MVRWLVFKAGVLFTCHEQIIVEGIDVVVVGGGIAGLTAARTLIDNWPSSVGNLHIQVLEAGDYVGGRTYSHTPSNPGWDGVQGAATDMGASWIHGSMEEHPITRLAEAAGLRLAETNGWEMSITQCANDSPSSCYQLADDAWSAYLQLLREAESSARPLTFDKSLWASLAGKTAGGGRDDPIMAFWLAQETESDYGASVKNLSAKYYNDDLVFHGRQMIIGAGYSQIVSAVQYGQVHLSTGSNYHNYVKVTADATNRRAIQVHTSSKVTNISRDISGMIPRIKLAYDQASSMGKELIADHVVVAVPLGVLKHGSIAFDPSLSAEKVRAIHNTGFGNRIKIGLRFDINFWSSRLPHLPYFGVVQSAGSALDFAEKFTSFLSLAEAIDQPVLFTWAVGHSAYEVEGWTETKIWTSIRVNLVKIFGDSVVPESYKGVWVSRWGLNPLFRGTYSYAKVGQEPYDWYALSEPDMSGQLHFAGEHTSRSFRGTVHGAFLSGQRAAREILTNITNGTMMFDPHPGVANSSWFAKAAQIPFVKVQICFLISLIWFLCSY